MHIFLKHKSGTNIWLLFVIVSSDRSSLVIRCYYTWSVTHFLKLNIYAIMYSFWALMLIEAEWCWISWMILIDTYWCWLMLIDADPITRDGCRVSRIYLHSTLSWEQWLSGRSKLPYIRYWGEKYTVRCISSVSFLHQTFLYQCTAVCIEGYCELSTQTLC